MSSSNNEGAEDMKMINIVILGMLCGVTAWADDTIYNCKELQTVGFFNKNNDIEVNDSKPKEPLSLSVVLGKSSGKIKGSGVGDISILKRINGFQYTETTPRGDIFLWSLHQNNGRTFLIANKNYEIMNKPHSWTVIFKCN